MEYYIFINLSTVLVLILGPAPYILLKPNVYYQEPVSGHPISYGAIIDLILINPISHG